MSETLGDWLKGRTAEGIISIVQNKIDMRQEGKRVDKIGDKAMTKASSERIQRGPITTALTQFILGMWDENPLQLAAFYRQEATTIEVNAKKKGK